MSKWDGVIIFAGCAISFFFIGMHAWNAHTQHAQYATVIHNGVVVHTIPLSKNQNYVYAPDATTRMTIRVENNKVCVVESSCQNKVCVHSGWIHTPGATLVCAPNHILITIDGKKNVDTVTH